MAKLQLVGKRFGTLKVIEENGRRILGRNCSVVWKCKCDCGAHKDVVSSALMKGDTTTCGKVECQRQNNPNFNRKDPQESAWFLYFRSYQDAGKSRNLSWELDITEFKTLTSENCHYCGLVPQPNYLARRLYLSCAKRGNGVADEEFASRKIILANGIDRVDNTKGYTKNNIVSCCSICNQAKHVLPKAEFESWALRLADNIRARQEKRVDVVIGL